MRCWWCSVELKAGEGEFIPGEVLVHDGQCTRLALRFQEEMVDSIVALDTDA